MKDVHSTACGQSQEWGIIVALLLTDGSVKKTKRKNSIIFANKSDVLHKIFKEVVQKVSEKKLHFVERIDKRNVKITEVNSKELVEKLLNILPTWRRKPYEDGSYPPVKIPDFIKKMENEKLRKVLQIMFSCDGSVVLGVKWHKTKKTWVFTRRVQITITHPVIRKDVKEILERLGFEPKVWRNEIVIDKKDDLIKFKKEIGFVNNVKISRKSRYWCGKDKNYVLTLLIKSFNFGASLLRKYKSPSEIINLLKTRS